MVAAIARIVAAVDIPVTADIESGYGPDPTDIKVTTTALIQAGAVGANLEDSRPDTGALHAIAAQTERLRAARDAADGAGLHGFVLNARTDVFLTGMGDTPEDRLRVTADRASAYAQAGADVVFVPGLVDLPLLARVVDASPLPVNVMAVPGGPTVAEFARVGVARVSLGTGLAQAAYTAAHQTARNLLTHGTFAPSSPLLDYPDMNALVR